MKRLFSIVLLLILGVGGCLSVYAQEQVKKKVAVYMTGASIDDAYKKVIGAKLVSAITASGEYAAVERTADFLAALSAENDYQTSGEVRDSQIARLGQKFGVRYVVVADVSELFSEYFIATRMIDVESGLVERAFDINGPAESMSQLVELSLKVADGLLKGVYTPSVDTDRPKHLSLCVVDKKGKVNYLTVEQWSKVPDDNKLDYTKKGVCIIEDGEGFLVSMRDAVSGDWYYACNNNAPRLWQCKLICKYFDPLNAALNAFAGEGVGYSWTCEGSYEKGTVFYFFGGGTYMFSKTDIYAFRPVFPVPES